MIGIWLLVLGRDRLFGVGLINIKDMVMDGHMHERVVNNAKSVYRRKKKVGI